MASVDIHQDISFNNASSLKMILMMSGAGQFKDNFLPGISYLLPNTLIQFSTCHFILFKFFKICAKLCKVFLGLLKAGMEIERVLINIVVILPHAHEHHVFYLSSQLYLLFQLLCILFSYVVTAA